MAENPRGDNREPPELLTLVPLEVYTSATSPGLSQVMASLGMPDDGRELAFRRPGKEFGRQLEGFDVTLVGIKIPYSAGPHSFPTYPLWDDQTRQWQLLQVWYLLLRPEGSALHATITWAPGEDLTGRLGGIVRGTLEEELRGLTRGLFALLGAIKREGPLGGQPKAILLTRAEFVEKWEELAGRWKRGRPKESDLANALGVSLRTVQRFRHDQRPPIPWPPR